MVSGSVTLYRTMARYTSLISDAAFATALDSCRQGFHRRSTSGTRFLRVVCREAVKFGNSRSTRTITGALRQRCVSVPTSRDDHNVRDTPRDVPFPRAVDPSLWLAFTGGPLVVQPRSAVIFDASGYLPLGRHIA
jgi:hypothetical protein